MLRDQNRPVEMKKILLGVGGEVQGGEGGRS